MNKTERISILCSVIFWILCTNFWVGNGTGIYYVGISQVVLVSSWIIHNKAKSKIDLFITRCFLFLAFNNFIDEIFFNPTKFELYEYIAVGGYFIYNYLSIYKKTWLIKAVGFVKASPKKDE